MRKRFKVFRKNRFEVKNSEQEISDYAKIGMIVERVNAVELRMNQVIAAFYVSPDKQGAFLEDFMFAGRLRLNDKIKIFTAILKRKNVAFDYKAFERWMNIRNMVAHGVPSRDHHTRRGTLSFNGKIYDIETEFRDFERLQSKIEAIFQNL